MERSFNALCGVSKPARCFLGSTPGGRAGLSTLISYVDQIPPNIFMKHIPYKISS